MERVYKCPICGSTKTLVKREHQTKLQFLSSLPEKLICGWRGCIGSAVREEATELRYRD